MKLGRTIGTGDQSSLILLHDYYGLPIEVILCICEYAGTKGKSANQAPAVLLKSMTIFSKADTHPCGWTAKNGASMSTRKPEKR